MSEKKIALVTGGSRGIGKAICVRLAKDGYDVVFNYRSGEEEAKETVALIEKEGREALGVKADISDSSACEALVNAAMERFGRVDVLVNNAGITRDGLLARMTDEDLEQVLAVNLKGSFYMMRSISRIMLKQRSGRIINMSSVVGIMGNPGQMNYAASKAGVIGMTKTLARELASRKINVNAVAPGMIETQMTDKIPEKAREQILASIPFHEMGKPEDIAEVVAFLAGPGGRYITGQVISVDGGMAI